MLLPLALWACAVVAPAPAAPPSVETLDAVLLRLEEAGQLAATDRPGAIAAWNTARARFEDEIEPGLRTQLDPLEVTAAEYSFSRIHQALAAGRDAGPEIGELAARLHPNRLATR